MDAPSLIMKYLVSAAFFEAGMMTLLVTVLSVLLGVLIGLLIAVLQESRIAAVQPLVIVYLWLFRGTPVLFQIIFIFNVLPQFGILLSGFACGIIALSLNEAAYMSEILRSGLQAVGRGQRMAGRALGMTDWRVMRYVVLPQALRIVIPPIGNQFIGMLKLSALISVIAIEELLLVANQTASSNFRYLEALSAAGIYYLIFTTIFMIFQARIENWATGRRGRTQTQRPGFFNRLLGISVSQKAMR
jgi:polar amino acid transport system permease protein